MADKTPLKYKDGHAHQFEAGDTINEGSLGTGINANKIADGSVSNTEFQYLGNVTSDIQTQLDGKTSDRATKTNNSGGTIEAGAPVYLEGDGEINKARANSTTTANVYALAVADIANAASGAVQFGGRLTLTTGQWDVITGQVGGLTTGSKYWLSPTTAGRLTTTPPTTAGQQSVWVGTAESTTVMRIDPQPYTGL